MLRIDQVDRVTQIKNKIRRMGLDYKPGNASLAGHLYSPLPFPEFADVPSQRGCVEERFALMRDDLLKFVRQGRILDVGCHAGFNCFKFDELGFDCTGIEADALTVEIARDVAELYGRDVEFLCGNATRELIEPLGRFDAVIFTAVFQWVTAAEGFATAKSLLRQLCRQCDVLYFETSMGQEGKAKMLMLPDCDAVERLLNDAGHRHVEMLGALDRSRFLYRTSRVTVEEVPLLEQLQRAIARCSHSEPFYAKRNRHFDARVWKQPLENGRTVAIKQIEALHPQAESLLFREHEFLAALDSPHFPQWVLNGKMEGRYVLVSEWIDGPLLSEQLTAHPEQVDKGLLREQLREIANLLQAAGISHRDLRAQNLLCSNRGLVLIDFGWASWKTELHPFTPPELVEPDDRRALENLLSSASEIATAASHDIDPPIHVTLRKTGKICRDATDVP